MEIAWKHTEFVPVEKPIELPWRRMRGSTSWTSTWNPRGSPIGIRPLLFMTRSGTPHGDGPWRRATEPQWRTAWNYPWGHDGCTSESTVDAPLEGPPEERSMELPMEPLLEPPMEPPWRPLWNLPGTMEPPLVTLILQVIFNLILISVVCNKFCDFPTPHPKESRSPPNARGVCKNSCDLPHFATEFFGVRGREKSQKFLHTTDIILLRQANGTHPMTWISPNLNETDEYFHGEISIFSVLVILAFAAVRALHSHSQRNR